MQTRNGLARLPHLSRVVRTMCFGYFFSWEEFSLGGGDLTVCQGSVIGFGLSDQDEPFLARSYCSSICLASRRFCALGSSLWECAAVAAKRLRIIAGTTIFFMITPPLVGRTLT